MMAVEIFPFEVDGERLFSDWHGANREWIKSTFTNGFSWYGCTAKIYSPTRIRFKIYERGHEYEDNYGRIVYGRGDLSYTFEAKVPVEFTARSISDEKFHLAMTEFERQEKLRLQLEYQAKINAVYTEMFGPENIIDWTTR
jgi:hypothetical protein